MNKERFRFYIKVRTALHIQPIVIDNQLYSVYSDEALPLRTVQRWSKWFCEGREEVEDEERSDGSIMKTTSENIEQVRDLINSSGQTSKKGNFGNFGNDTCKSCYFEKFDNFQNFHNFQFAKFLYPPKFSKILFFEFTCSCNLWKLP
jgi:hypothetical protein